MPDTPSNRYRLPAGSEVEFQSGSRGKVLRNKLGITKKMEIDRAEYDALLEAQERSLRIVRPDTQFTTSLIRQLHRDWLGGIYSWAGVFRTVNLTKGGFTWPPAARVPHNMAAFEQGLLGELTPCRPGPLAVVAGRIATVHAEFLLIHPFREGNGRLARWLAELMAYQAGLPTPMYRFAGRGSQGKFDRYVQAVREGYVQDYAALTAFFTEAFEAALRREGRD